MRKLWENHRTYYDIIWYINGHITLKIPEFDFLGLCQWCQRTGWNTCNDCPPFLALPKRHEKFWGTNTWLVVYLPLWKMMEFVSWDDECSNIWKVIKAIFQTTNQILTIITICGRCAKNKDPKYFVEYPNCILGDFKSRLFLAGHGFQFRCKNSQRVSIMAIHSQWKITLNPGLKTKNKNKHSKTHEIKNPSIMGFHQSHYPRDYPIKNTMEIPCRMGPPSDKLVYKPH